VLAAAVPLYLPIRPVEPCEDQIAAKGPAGRHVRFPVSWVVELACFRRSIRPATSGPDHRPIADERIPISALPALDAARKKVDW